MDTHNSSRISEATAGQPSRRNPMHELGGANEITKPPLKTFVEVGEQHEGFLVDLDTTGEIHGYVFESMDGRRFRLNQTADLKQKLRPADHLEHYVIVTYKGVDQNVGRDKGNDMRLFKVEVSARARK